VLTDVNTVELCTTTVQTDSICDWMTDHEVNDREIQTDIVDMCSTNVQTDAIELSATAVQTDGIQESREQNLLTSVPNSLIVSIRLLYFYMVKLESISQLSKCIKYIEDWFLSCELEPTYVKLFKITEKIVITFEVAPGQYVFPAHALNLVHPSLMVCLL